MVSSRQMGRDGASEALLRRARLQQRTLPRGPATGVSVLAGLIQDHWYSRADAIRDGIPLIYQKKGRMQVSYTA